MYAHTLYHAWLGHIVAINQVQEALVVANGNQVCEGATGESPHLRETTLPVINTATVYHQFTAVTIQTGFMLSIKLCLC